MVNITALHSTVAKVSLVVVMLFSLERVLGWKFLSCSHCQELCQLADLASDWLFTLV